MIIMRHDHVSIADLNLLPALRALLEEGNVTAAARRMGVTQSAMSRSLGRLRELFEDPLFVRVGRGLGPTRLARELAGPLERSLDDVERLLGRRDAFDPRRARRRFRIAAIDYPQLTVLAPLVRRIARTAPGIDLEIRQVSSANDRELESGALDLLLSPRQPSGAGIVWTRLFADRYVCITDAARRLRRLTLATFLELKHVFVAPRERPGGAVDEALAERGLHRRVALQVPGFLLLPEVLAGTPYIATVPHQMARLLARRRRLRILPPPIPIPGFTMCQAWHEVHRDDPGHRWLRGECVRAVRAR
jgi:DNA-binding transcriptional LysR family regulator